MVFPFVVVVLLAFSWLGSFLGHLILGLGGLFVLRRKTKQKCSRAGGGAFVGEEWPFADSVSTLFSSSVGSPIGKCLHIPILCSLEDPFGFRVVLFGTCVRLLFNLFPDPGSQISHRRLNLRHWVCLAALGVFGVLGLRWTGMGLSCGCYKPFRVLALGFCGSFTFWVFLSLLGSYFKYKWRAKWRPKHS